MTSRENKKEENKPGRGVLMEDLDAKLDLVLEGYSALDKKIDQHHEEFVGFRSETNFKFEFVFEKFGEIEGRFDGIDGRFSGIDGALREIRYELNNKVDRTEFELFRKEFGQLRNA